MFFIFVFYYVDDEFSLSSDELIYFNVCLFLTWIAALSCSIYSFGVYFIFQFYWLEKAGYSTKLNFEVISEDGIDVN